MPTESNLPLPPHPSGDMRYLHAILNMLDSDEKRHDFRARLIGRMSCYITRAGFEELIDRTMESMLDNGLACAPCGKKGIEFEAETTFKGKPMCADCASVSEEAQSEGRTDAEEEARYSDVDDRYEALKNGDYDA